MNDAAPASGTHFGTRPDGYRNSPQHRARYPHAVPDLAERPPLPREFTRHPAHAPGGPAPGRLAASHSVRHSPPQGLLPDSLTDRGNAKLFVRLYGRDFRHVTGLGWHRWTGYRWKFDEDGAVLWAAGEMAEALVEDDPRGVFSGTALRRHRRRALSTAGIRAMLVQAKTAPGMVLNAALLDSDPYALCTPGGVVDLCSARLVPPDPHRHLHSRATAVTPRATPVPRWRRFLTDAFGDDDEGQELIAYLQELLGYSLTGEPGSRAMPLLQGQPGSDRSVLLNVLVRLLGDYAATAPPGFLSSRAPTAHPTELAELQGRRVLVCPLPHPGDKVDESRVQLLTGTERIRARGARQGAFAFKPTHKLWLVSSHRPDTGTGSHAFWRRLKPVPYRQPPGEGRDVERLTETLVAEEGPGILHWLSLGAVRYLAGSRELTGPVRLRTPQDGNAVGASLSPTARFLAERCTLDPAVRTEQTQLYGRYKKWCAEQGERPDSSRAFAAKVREAVGIATPKQMVLSNQRKYYPGIAIDAPEEEVA